MSIRKQVNLCAASIGALTLIAVEVGACPVCFSPSNEANRRAFEWSTLLLSLIPLVFIGCTVAWLVRRSRQLDAEEASTDPA